MSTPLNAVSHGRQGLELKLDVPVYSLFSMYIRPFVFIQYTDLMILGLANQRTWCAKPAYASTTVGRDSFDSDYGVDSVSCVVQVELAHTNDGWSKTGH